MNLCEPLNMLRNQKSSNTTHNTTTRPIRYVILAPIHIIGLAYVAFFLIMTLQDGRPVYIEVLGNIDIEAMYKITTGERMLQNLVCEYEKLTDPRLPACSRKAGKLLETCCTIIDMKNVGLFKAPSVYGYLKQASAISQNYYPERLGKLYIINAPWGFSSIFSVVKSFLDPVTVNKIHVLGTGYQHEVLAQVPVENLPKEYGGTCECDEGCKLSDAGPWHDPKWTKPPKWEQKDKAEGKAPSKAKDQPTIENKADEDEKEKLEGSKGDVEAGAKAPATTA